LVMEYLGTNDGPSPRIRDIILENPNEIFNDLLNFIQVAWRDADLVHADLSEYNVLWHNSEPWIIDVGQAVKTAHPNAEEFLIRDVRNICNWAKKKGVEAPFEETLLRILEG
jgi:serine/threonine-protein kinase RIO1